MVVTRRRGLWCDGVMTAIARADRWSCFSCGSDGPLPRGETLDTYQCPQCGEPVFPG